MKKLKNTESAQLCSTLQRPSQGQLSASKKYARLRAVGLNLKNARFFRLGLLTLNYQAWMDTLLTYTYVLRILQYKYCVAPRYVGGCRFPL